VRPAAEPASGLQDLLARLWGRVLGATPESPEADFFAMGGDSLSAIRLAELAREADVALLPGDVLRHPRLGELAAAAGAASGPAAGPEPKPGRTPLTPPQQQWLRGNSPTESKIACTMVAARELDAGALEAAARLVVERHDALRERFLRDAEEGWSGFVDAEVVRPPVRSVDLTEAGPGTEPEELRRLTAEARAEIDIGTGPLVRLVHVRLRPPQDARLILVCHNLAMDHFSAAIFLGDLFAAYRQLAAGGAPDLPPPGTGLSTWAHRLREHAQTESVRRDAPYWLDKPWDQARPLPAAFPGPEAESPAGEVMTSVVLPPGATGALLRRCGGGRVSMLGTLLAVIARAHHVLTGAPVLAAYVVRHGRERVFADLDVSRSVGWFAHRIPWLVDVRTAPSAGTLAARVSEELAGLPAGGLHHGLLCDLTDDEGIRAAMRALPRPETVIQYLGVGQPLDQGIWPSSLGTEIRGIVAEQASEEIAPNYDWVRLWCHGRIWEGRLHLRLYLFTVAADGRAVKQPVRGLAGAVVDEVRALLGEAERG
jgi:hypothetical protein